MNLLVLVAPRLQILLRGRPDSLHAPYADPEHNVHYVATTACEYCASLTPDLFVLPNLFLPAPAPVLPPVSYGSLSPLRLPLQLLTDAEFKQATWDYVQNTATATTKWGDIGDLDVSGVKDFSYSLSKHRNQAGGSYLYVPSSIRLVVNALLKSPTPLVSQSPMSPHLVVAVAVFWT